MRLVAALRRRRHDAEGRRQRGAALVEFVLIAPVLVLIVAGIFEFGLAFRDSMTLSNGLRSGARVGSNAGREREADFTILKSVEAAMTAVPTAQINRLIVYKAQTADSSVPAACLAITGSGGVNGVCNVYQTSDLARPLEDFGDATSCSGTAPDRYWCPTSRQNQQALGADYLGVWMEIRYNFVTGVLPGTGLTIRDKAIMRLEPRLI